MAEWITVQHEMPYRSTQKSWTSLKKHQSRASVMESDPEGTGMSRTKEGNNCRGGGTLSRAFHSGVNVAKIKKVRQERPEKKEKKKKKIRERLQAGWRAKLRNSNQSGDGDRGVRRGNNAIKRGLSPKGSTP